MVKIDDYLFGCTVPLNSWITLDSSVFSVHNIAQIVPNPCWACLSADLSKHAWDTLIFPSLLPQPLKTMRYWEVKDWAHSGTCLVELNVLCSFVTCGKRETANSQICSQCAPPPPHTHTYTRLHWQKSQKTQYTQFSIHSILHTNLKITFKVVLGND